MRSTVRSIGRGLRGLLADRDGHDLKGGAHLVCAPAFTADEDWADFYHRLLWHLSPVADRVAAVWVTGPATAAIPEAPPPYLDPAARQFDALVREKIRRFADDATGWAGALRGAEHVLRWDIRARHPDAAVEALLSAAIAGKKVWRVDHRRVRNAGSFFLFLSHELSGREAEDLTESRRRMRRMLDELGGASRVYVFGTGPSLEAAMGMDFGDGVTIACNSMVKNQPLMERLRPRIIAMADPIFHAGASSYAGSFRRALAAAMGRHEAWLVVPQKHLPVYRHALPAELEPRLIGVPMSHERSVNLDLSRDLEVKTTANVLTVFLLPLACSLSREVGILGCDGRPRSENGYFWQHHAASQFDAEMEAIKRAHPAFFEIDYNDYYDEHCATLAAWLEAGERQGARFVCLGPSHIPALRQRGAPMPGGAP